MVDFWVFQHIFLISPISYRNREHPYGYFQDDVTEITLFNDGENKISYSQITSDLNDGGWLYTPNGKHICFFPTVGYDFDGYTEMGLDPRYTAEGVEHSIAFGIDTQTLKLCSEPADVYYESIELFDQIEPNQVQTIFRPCAGRVGEDCPAVDYNGKSCSVSFPKVRAYRGCWVMATTEYIEPFQGRGITCAWWEAPAGQVLTPYLLGYSEFGNLKAVEGTMGVAKPYVKAEGNALSTLQKEWRSIKGEALVCAGNRWQSCRENNQGVIISDGVKSFRCMKQDGILVWQ